MNAGVKVTGSYWFVSEHDYKFLFLVASAQYRMGLPFCDPRNKHLIETLFPSLTSVTGGDHSTPTLLPRMFVLDIV